MIHWEDYTWDEIEKLIPKLKAVILPVGSCEQHSLHLPLGTDTFSVIKLSEDIAKELEGQVLVLPPIWYGVSPHHMNFPGTITISPETLMALVYEIAESLYRHGVERMIIINGHGGNIDALKLVIRRISDDLGMKVVLINPWELISDVIEKVVESKIWGHACEFETSTALIEIPDKVRVNKIRKPNIRIPKIPYMALWEKNKVITPWNTDDFTDTGAIGDPTKASKEKGEKLYKAMFERTLDFIKKFIES